MSFKTLDKMLNKIKYQKITSSDKSIHPLDNMRTPLLGQIRKNSEKVFYVCSFGGCGSKMLCAYLSKFGTVKHVHSRCPPQSLTQIDKNEWFSSQPIDEKDLPNYYVIYIYRDPVKAILSRFTNAGHLAHIQANPKTTLQQVLQERKDLYGIENFYENYTTAPPATKKRNYKIYCVKYEELFKKMDVFNHTFHLPCDEAIYPREKTTPKPYSQEVGELEQIYKPLRGKMQQMPFIKVV